MDAIDLNFLERDEMANAKKKTKSKSKPGRKKLRISVNDGAVSIAFSCPSWMLESLDTIRVLESSTYSRTLRHACQVFFQEDRVEYAYMQMIMGCESRPIQEKEGRPQLAYQSEIRHARFFLDESIVEKIDQLIESECPEHLANRRMNQLSRSFVIRLAIESFLISKRILLKPKQVKAKAKTGTKKK